MVWTRTPKVQALGTAIRQARMERGWTLREFAARMGRELSVVSRWETGNRAPKPEQVAQMLTVLGVYGQRYEEIVSLAYDPDAPLWAANDGLPERRSQMIAFLDFERNATTITEVAPLLVPGLLQTHGYVEAIMRGGTLPEEEIPERIGTRMARRMVLEDHDPPKLRVLLGEGVLYQMVGGREVMLEQLHYLLAAMRRPNVELRIVPFTAGWTPMLDGTVTIITPSAGRAVVVSENRRSGIFLHKREDVAAFEDAVTLALEEAQSEQDSAITIAERIARLEPTP